MKFVKEESNSSTVETNCRNGKSVVKSVDMEAVEKLGHVLLFVRGMQVAFELCAETKENTLRQRSNNEPVDPRIALSEH
jgi:hypothetical protein